MDRSIFCNIFPYYIDPTTHARAQPLRKDAAIDIHNIIILDDQRFRKENNRLKVFIIATAAVSFCLMIVYLLFFQY